MRILIALALILAACGTKDVTAPVAEPPAISASITTVDRTIVLGALVGATATVAVMNTGGPGVYQLESVADSARTNPCLMNVYGTPVSAVGTIGKGDTRLVTAVTYCSNKLDYVVVYGGGSSDLNHLPPVACYAVMPARPCPPLSELVKRTP